MERIVTHHCTKALAGTLLLLALSFATAQAQFYYLGTSLFPSDVSGDGSIVVGNVEGGGTFADPGGYFDWIRDAVPANPDPASWALGIGGGMDIDGGPTGGSPSISNDGRYVSGTALNPVTGWAEMSILDRNTIVGTEPPVWTSLGSFGKELDDDASAGYNISGNGQHVVGMGWRTPGLRGADAAIWSVGDSGLTALGRAFQPPPDGVYTNAFTARANAVSEDGSVVVGYQDGPNVITRNGMIWVDGVATKRFTKAGEATAVSEDGTWVVGLDHAYGQPGDFNADGTVNLIDYTVWRNNLGMPAVSLLNDVDGGTVGAAQYETWRDHLGEVEPARTRDAWRWSEETGLEPLGRMTEGSFRGVATAVNADGTIILGFDAFFGTSAANGWIWQEGSGFSDLNTYFTSMGVETGDYDFNMAVAMSADGRTFVGRGYQPGDPYDSGWIVTLPEAGAALITTSVPEPTSWVAMMMAAVLAAFGIRRKRQYAVATVRRR